MCVFHLDRIISFQAASLPFFAWEAAYIMIQEPVPVLGRFELEVRLVKPEAFVLCEAAHLSPELWARAAKPPELMLPPRLACYLVRNNIIER